MWTLKLRKLTSKPFHYNISLQNQIEQPHQPRSQGLSSSRPSEREETLSPLSLGREDERPWKRGCIPIGLALIAVFDSNFTLPVYSLLISASSDLSFNVARTNTRTK